MESSWRMNVITLGVNGDAILWLAPILTLPGEYLAKPEVDYGEGGYYYRNLGGDRGWGFAGLAFGSHPHFPYGFHVGPDLH